jgi:hypothetical protein
MNAVHCQHLALHYLSLSLVYKETIFATIILNTRLYIDLNKQLKPKPRYKLINSSFQHR